MNPTLADFGAQPAPSRNARVFAAAQKLAATCAPFNANHLRASVPGANGLVIAAAMSTLAKKGKIEPANLPPEPATAPNSRGRFVRWWMGKLPEGGKSD